MVASPRFHAFLSYSHAADARTAAAMQAALQRIGKRWYARGKVRVFRDQTSLAAAPGLWAEIERHLADAAWFVLMASPEAAESPWVRKEVQWWLQHRAADRLLVVLTSGALAWDAHLRRFSTEQSRSLPPTLLEAWADEPLWVDMRWAAGEPHLNLRHARFRDAALTLAARLQGRPKDELDSAEIREHRRFVTALWVAGVSFNVLLLAAVAAWWQARDQQHRAEDNWREAQSQRLSSMALEELDQGHFDDAAQLAVLAWRLDAIGPAGAVMRRVVASGQGVAGVLGQHAGGVAVLAFSGDGRLLVSGGQDGSLMRWRSADWQREGALLGNADPATSDAARRLDGLRVNANGEQVFAWKSNGIAWWWQPRNARVQRLDLKLQKNTYLNNAAISPNGQRVVLVLQDKVTAWQPADGAMLELRMPVWAASAIGACFVDDTRVRLLATTKRRVDYADEGLRILEWQPAGGSAREDQVREGQIREGRIREGPMAREGRRSMIHIVRVGLEPVWSADCSQFVLWDGGRPVVWSVAPTLALRRDVVIGTDAVADTAGHGSVQAWFTGRRVGVAAQEDYPKKGARWTAWAAGDAAAPAAMTLPGATFPLATSPDGRWLAATGGDGLVLWDSQAGAWGAPAARRLAVSCNEADEQCAARLCQALGKRFDEAQLRKLFGLANYEYFYDTYKRVVDAAACPPEPAVFNPPPAAPVAKASAPR
jgi:TIR domain/WD domain, G-beta repeat